MTNLVNGHCWSTQKLVYMEEGIGDQVDEELSCKTRRELGNNVLASMRIFRVARPACIHFFRPPRTPISFLKESFRNRGPTYRSS